MGWSGWRTNVGSGEDEKMFVMRKTRETGVLVRRVEVAIEEFESSNDSF